MRRTVIHGDGRVSRRLQVLMCVATLATFGCGRGGANKHPEPSAGAENGGAAMGSEASNVAGGAEIGGRMSQSGAGERSVGTGGAPGSVGGIDFGGAGAGSGGDGLGGEAPDCLSDPRATPSKGECSGGPSDPGNCGACGVDCGGGWCGEGTCRTVASLVAGLIWPSSVSVSDGGLLFLSKGPALEAQGVLSSLTLGCPLEAHPVVPGLMEPDTLTVSGRGLYWFARQTAEPGASLISLLAGDEAPTPLATGLDEPGYQIAVDASFVYIPIQGVPPSFQSGGGVFRCALSGCLEGPTLLASGDEYYRPTGALVSDGSLYWSLQGTLPAFVDGKLVRCASEDCAATTTTIFEGARGPRSPVLADDFLYWVEEGTAPTYKDGGVRRCNPDDCQASAKPVVSNLGRPFKLAVDGDFVFVSEQLGAYGIVRAPIELGVARRLATTATPVTSLALDQDHVYFTESGDETQSGALLRVHR